MDASVSDIPPIVIRAATMDYDELRRSGWDATKQRYRPHEENAGLQVQLWYAREVDHQTHEEDLLRNPHSCVLLSTAQWYARERILRNACVLALQALQTRGTGPTVERACEQLQQAIKLSDEQRDRCRAHYRLMREGTAHPNMSLS